jgi:hypothetical protein
LAAPGRILAAPAEPSPGRLAYSAPVQPGFGIHGVMGVMRRRPILLLPATVPAALAFGPAGASEGDGQERARAALGAGQIRPLAEILAEVERRYLGRVIETDLEREHGRWIYEFTLLPPTGRVFELEIDAATGALLRSKGPVQERR